MSGSLKQYGWWIPAVLLMFGLLAAGLTGCGSDDNDSENAPGGNTAG